uniref:Serum response factor-binding protein 1 n=1 Tax=Cyprinus carpio TaxID=7962 RepID=A0A8C1SPS7_CYPCA
MPAVLILSNEVVKMRPEVKRVKVLIIRKLIRQISVLEKKKGSEADLEKFRRRAARLREEIHELKAVAPDSVTKAALQKDISFEKVCRNKEASLSERVIARIATHPQFSKKIQSIKAAIKAFKEERMNALNPEKQAKISAENATIKSQADSDDDVVSEKSNDEVDDEKLKEEEGDKKTDEDRREEIDVSSQESQKTSLETTDEQTSPCQKEESLTAEESSETVAIPEEVIRMRKEVKRTRVLIISKMAEQAAALKKKKKKKKGQESEVKESQERAADIMKEIKALRSLKLDQVTMTALEENVDLEKILQDPQASPVDRAIAHIATHSRFINKLQKVKEAIKEEKAKAAEAEQKKTDRLDIVQSKKEDEEEEEHEEDEEPEDDHNSDDSEEDGDVVEEKLNSPTTEIHKSSVVELTESTDSDLVKVPPSKTITTSLEKSKRVEIKSQKAEAMALNVQSSSEKSSTVSKKNAGKANKEIETTLKPQKKKDLPETKRAEVEKDDEESDLSDEEEEKEYFDDSTEERFHKQSSQSEESDDDDFFLGKVSKFKKRKSNQGKVEEKKSELQKTDEEATSKPQETNLGKLQSVFCSALSKSTMSSQKAKFGSRNDGPRPPRFQNQRKGPEGRMKAAQYKGQDRRTGPFNPNRQTFKVDGQRQAGPSGTGRGRSQFEQNRNPRGPPGRMSDPPQQSLHPSWEASRKRKEQQAQITAFQGKKIRFDDD